MSDKILDKISEISVYERLSKARIEIQKNKPVMTGENKFTGYKYYQLEDIMPVINIAELNNGICSYFTMKENQPKLTIKNVKNLEQEIVFEMDFVEAKLKGASDIQNRGSSRTYFHRYLLLAAYNISDNDWVDSCEHIISKNVSKLQLDNLESLIELTKIDRNKLLDYVKTKYKKLSFEEMNLEEYIGLFSLVETKLPKQEIKDDIDKVLDGEKNGVNKE